jgi:hypothetical protein
MMDGSKNVLLNLRGESLYVNAGNERYIRTFKKEIIWPYEYDSFEQAVEAVRGFIKF